ncbi:MAG: hypothetical protein L0Y80_11730 [Ignavibacteriae bacterium]|nr:hypothetical protein [Ignavibacteriota bacterium]
MKKTIYLFYALAAVALILLATTKSEAAVTPYEVDGSIDFFYSSLSPHGEWIEISAGYYGWRPMRLHRSWRPYLYGRWAWTDYGWYWISDEPFGWAVYHYGRWYYDDYYGWIWIPDRVWGPAWVEWRYNDDYIGWAPLPPYASFSFSIGIRFTTRWYAPYSYWSFVRYRHFGSHSVYQYCSPPEYTRRLIGNTRTAVRYEVDRDRVINRGVDRTYVERRGKTRVESYDVTTTRNRGNGAERERTVRDGGRERIEVYRPDTDDSRERNVRIEARRPERRLSLEVDRINRGDIERQTEMRNTDPGRENRTRESGNTRGTQGTPERGRERDDGVSHPSERSQDTPQRDAVQQQQREREERTTPYYERREMTKERIENRGRSSPPKSEPQTRPAPQSRPRESAPPQRSGGNSRSSGGSRNRGR